MRGIAGISLLHVEKAIGTEEHLAKAAQSIESRVGSRRVFRGGLFGMIRANRFGLFREIGQAARNVLAARIASKEKTPCAQYLRARIPRRLFSEASRHVAGHTEHE